MGHGSHSARFAEVSVGQKDGTIRVHRIVVAVDCGPATAPLKIQTQIEGGVTMALGTTLKEEVKFANGGWYQPIPMITTPIRLSEIPDIEVHIIKSHGTMGGNRRTRCAPDGPSRGQYGFQRHR
ncbi:MAG: xanthine dehydrogenase family protein molybdopterin-binding subunit [Desulfobacterales bacterium]|nr:MAG: xanthine dehydrogenase family protein molybdopterin-binding subunit [Desulfobacterales bacterium]